MAVKRTLSPRLPASSSTAADTAEISEGLSGSSGCSGGASAGLAAVPAAGHAPSSTPTCGVQAERRSLVSVATGGGRASRDKRMAARCTGRGRRLPLLLL